MKNICIVGYGAIGPVHSKAISRIENTKLYAVCDIDKKRADDGAKQYQCKALYSFEDVLNDKNIDSVHICTPHYLHHTMAIAAARAGKEVVLEKPVAVSREAFEELRGELAGKRTCVVLQNRMNNCVKKCKEIINEDTSLGKFIGGFASVTWSRDEKYYRQADWRGRWETEGGGLMINQAVHLVDLIAYLAGEIKSVKASMSNKTLAGVIQVEDTCDALLTLKNGAKICFYGTNGYCSNMPFRLELQFENAVLRYADDCLCKIVKGKSVELICTNSTDFDGKPYWGSSHHTVLDNFYNGGIYPSLDDAINTMDALYAFYESAKDNSKEIYLKG